MSTIDFFGRVSGTVSVGVSTGELSNILGGYVNKTGDTVSGVLNMGGNNISNLANPLSDSDAATKSYVDSFVPLSGGTMTGDLILSTGTNNSINLGCRDLTGTKGFNILLGTDLEQLQCRVGAPATMITNNGFFYICSGNPMVRFGFSASDFRTMFFQDILMEQHFITNLHDPNSAQDAATKNYVDQRVLKSGDTMTGNLILSIGTDTVRSLGCMNLTGTSIFEILLGSPSEYIQCQVGLSTVMFTNNGFLIQCNSNDVVRFGSSSIDFRTQFYKDIVMNNNFIANLADPNSAQDAATKNYVDQRVLKSGDTMSGALNMSANQITSVAEPTLAQDAATKNYVDTSVKKSYSGYIPILEGNNSRLGFIVTASSIAGGGFNGYGIFNNLNADGANGSWVTNLSTTGWIQIQCPDAVRVWRVALKARQFPNRNITAWNIAGSNNGTTFTTLLTSTTVLSGGASTPSYFNISTTVSYWYYRFNITASAGATDVGVQVMQLYTYST